MKQYTNGEKTIYATERAFNVLYKDLGFNLMTTKDAIEEVIEEQVKDNSNTEIKEVSKGVFELPNGEKVKGKKNAESRLNELKGE